MRAAVALASISILVSISPTSEASHPSLGLAVAHGVQLRDGAFVPIEVSFGLCPGVVPITITLGEGAETTHLTGSGWLSYIAPPELEPLADDACLYEYLRPLTLFSLSSSELGLDTVGVWVNPHLVIARAVQGTLDGDPVIFAKVVA